MFRNIVLTLSFILGLGATPAFSAGIPILIPQGPCPLDANEQCYVVNRIPVSPSGPRQFSFNVPGPGRALVSFNGSMQCTNLNPSGSGSFGVADLETGILAFPTDFPDHAAAGGNRYAMRIVPDSPINFSNAINLATSAIYVYPSTGRRTVYYRIQPRRLDAQVSCIVFSAEFTVQFYPN